MSDTSMYGILNLFRKDSICDLNGQYCRMLIDDSTGRVESIRNIVYDEMGELVDDPIA